MPVTDRVKQILSHYASENPGTLTNLYRLLNAGQLAGTGKLVILPVDQGFEHGPARTFAPNPEGYDPDYHYQLAIDAGCSAYAAPLGALEAGAAKFAGQIPLILKLNNSDTLAKIDAPCSAITGSVEDALRLGCVGIGYTIYPGSSQRNRMYEDLRELTLEAKRKGLVVVTWSYPRGAGISKAGETGLDICAYAAHIAAQLGSHIIKVKPPTAHLEQEESKKALEKAGVKIDTLADRARYVVQATFNGKRIVIFSGGEAKGTEDVLNDVRELAKGGAFGSIMGRNAFQRPRAESLRLLNDVMSIFRNALSKENLMSIQHVSYLARGGGSADAELAVPAGEGQVPAVVLIQEWWGLNDHIRSILQRLAEAGFLALAPDLYHGKSTADAEEAGKLMTELDTLRAVREIGGGVDFLRTHERSNGRVGVIGFCMGGALTFASACHIEGLGAAVPFYGIPPAEKVDYTRVTAPILAHFASRDGWAPPDRAREIQKQIEAAGKSTMRLEIYEADHAFMNDTRPEVYSAEAAASAWDRSVAFLHENLRLAGVSVAPGRVLQGAHGRHRSPGHRQRWLVPRRCSADHRHRQGSGGGAAGCGGHRGPLRRAPLRDHPDPGDHGAAVPRAGDPEEPCQGGVDGGRLPPGRHRPGARAAPRGVTGLAAGRRDAPDDAHPAERRSPAGDRRVRGGQRVVGADGVPPDLGAGGLQHRRGLAARS
jgi:class I fructose-bisphosphate aldolase